MELRRLDRRIVRATNPRDQPMDGTVMSNQQREPETQPMFDMHETVITDWKGLEWDDLPRSPLFSNPAHPSRYLVHPWIGTAAPNVPPGPYPRMGKWLVFASRPWVDVRWAAIRAATERGDLGIAAKVSTALHPGRSHVICVYTADWQDRADVARVLAALRALGVGRRLFYKTDEQTANDVYAHNGMRASVYCSDAFETLPLWDDSAFA